MKIYDMLLAQAMGEGGGGGGGGDFATAEVTFNATEGFFTGSDEDSYIVALIEDNGRYLREESLSSSTYKILLLENSASCIFVYSEPVITGNASAAIYPDTGEWLVTITGDCTITIS